MSDVEITQPQRATLSAVAASSRRRLVRCGTKPAGYALDGAAEPICRLTSIRKLVARGLLAWDGVASDPERAAALTERGRFEAAK